MYARKCKVLVIGAGIIGLSTATAFQELFPSASVTIAADKFLSDTTSDGAAGIFRPATNFSGPSIDVSLKWLRNSFKFYEELYEKYGQDEAAIIGIRRIKILHFSTENPSITENWLLESIVGNYQRLSASEISLLVSGNYISGSAYDTILTECRKYMPYLTKKFQENGGLIINKTFKSFEDVSSYYDIVFNCSGLGAKNLCGDHKVVPIRGQVLKVKAPWIKEAIYVDTDTYIIPGIDGVVTLGGTRQFDSLRNEINKFDSADILQRCLSVLPSLKNAEIVREWVGFRPYRSEIRIEREVIQLSNGRKLMVIHNYGHGGYGVTSAPGTSMEAVELAAKILKEGIHSEGLPIIGSKL